MSRRERRVTAGQRMTALIGKAEEEDEAFWNHSTWKEDVDFEGQAIEQQEDASFHESDEDESDREDVFDSDFDETESENDEKGLFDDDAELEAHQEEIKMLKKKKVLDMIRADRVSKTLKRKTASGKKSCVRMGEGLNAGLILNAPGTILNPKASMRAVPPIKATVNVIQTDTGDVHKPSPSTLMKSSPVKVENQSHGNHIKQSPRKKRKPSHLNNMEMFQGRQSPPEPPAVVKKIKKQEFTQEDLLFEAIHHTEPENLRWILSRQRVLEDAKALEMQKKMMNDEASAANRKVICRFHSKRGCYNTITFPDMDHVPDILVSSAGKNTTFPVRKRDTTKCVITGKIGKYRDPKTGKRYHDLAAFKELRRRLEAGEPLCR